MDTTECTLEESIDKLETVILSRDEITRRRKNTMSFYNFGRAVTTAFVRIIYRLRFEGLENVPEDRGFILCSNHISDLDPILVAIRVKPQCFFMAKEELFKIPVLASIVRALGAFPVARGKGDTAAIDHAVDVVNSGHVLAIFRRVPAPKTANF